LDLDGEKRVGVDKRADLELLCGSGEQVDDAAVERSVTG
jgi:hypothetical protein